MSDGEMGGRVSNKPKRHEADKNRHFMIKRSKLKRAHLSGECEDRNRRAATPTYRLRHLGTGLNARPGEPGPIAVMSIRYTLLETGRHLSLELGFQTRSSFDAALNSNGPTACTLHLSEQDQAVSRRHQFWGAGLAAT